MEEIAEIKKTLENYNSNFAAMKYVKHKTKSEVGQTIKKIEEDNNGFLGNGLESNRAQNLLSFLYFVIGDLKKALDLNTKVQKEDPTNIVALCNKAWILYHGKQYSECQTIIKILAHQNDDRLSHLTSKAEVAYSYSCLGMHAYEEAIKIFDEVKKECQECGKIDDCQSEIDSDQQSATKAGTSFVIPKENICIWTFGLALISRRRIHLYCHDEKSNSDMSKQRYARVLLLFYEVASMQESTSLIKKYRGRAYAEIGHVIYSIEKITPKVFADGVKSIVPGNSQLHKNSKFFYDLGLQIGPNDPYVLSKLGVYYRYIGRIDESILLLNTSLNTKKSSSTYHHLGLSLQRQIILKQPKFRNHSNRTSNVRSQRGPFHYTNKMREKNVVTHYSNQPDYLSTSLSSLSLKSSSAVGCALKKPQTRICARQPPNAKSANPATVHTPITNMIKNPRYLICINKAEYAETVKRIFEYYDKAIELCKNNYSALYDKGLLHRYLEQNKEAVDIFRDLISCIEDKHDSRIILANAYEQAAFCCLDMMVTGEVDETLKANVRIYLKIAIEISCDLVGKIPFLDNCWKGLQMLRSIIEGKSKSKQTLEDQHFLCQKLRNFENDIDILNELKAIAEDDTEKMLISLKIARDYIILKRYDEAVYILDIMIYCGYLFVDANDRSLYLTAHIYGGIEAYKRNEKGLATVRFRKALNFKRTCEDEELNINEDIDDSGHNEPYDIYIACQVEAEETGRRLAALIKNTGLRVTLNDDEVLPGSWIPEGVLNIIELSTHFIILVDKSMSSLPDNLEETINTAAKVIEDRNYGKVLVVKTELNVDVPTVLKTYLVVNFFEIAMNTTCDDITDPIWQKLGEMFLQLA